MRFRAFINERTVTIVVIAMRILPPVIVGVYDAETARGLFDQFFLERLLVLAWTRGILEQVIRFRGHG